MSFNLMAAITICSYFGAPPNSLTLRHCLHWTPLALQSFIEKVSDKVSY